ncbi:MAG: ISNCY family transposase [Candidatus Acidiferrales bacterium]
MAEERIGMGAGERDRLKVLHQVQAGHITQRQAAERLSRSTRQVRRMQRRVEAEGDGGIIHRLRGRPSNRKIGQRQQRQMLRELRTACYAGCGPTWAAEQLLAQGHAVSRETLRQWMAAGGLWQPRRRSLQRVHVWRERRAAFGKLVMMDSSEFAWLEQRGPYCYLIAMIDDATSRIWARFVERDTTDENLRTLQGWLQRHGRPLAWYTDKDSILQPAGAARPEDQRSGRPARTQFGRALADPDIRWIAAHSPQAKGRSERLFGTLQDRLVKQMRLAEVCSIEQANRFLHITFLPEWQQRFTVRPRQPHDAHRRLARAHRLEQILSVRMWRTVAQDATAPGWQPLAEFSRALLDAAALPRRGALRCANPFRPAASRGQRIGKSKT